MKEKVTSRALTEKQRDYIGSLRRELGIKTEKLPATSREGSRLIDALLQRKESAVRRRVAEEAGAARPSESVLSSITAVAGRLGISVPEPESAMEARFVLDDLYHRERLARRVADGSAG